MNPRTRARSLSSAVTTPRIEMSRRRNGKSDSSE
jgi:hypothetical protein